MINSSKAAFRVQWNIKMKLFAIIVNRWKPLTFLAKKLQCSDVFWIRLLISTTFAKNYILNVREGSECDLLRKIYEFS